MPTDYLKTARITMLIPWDELEFTYVRSSGPGGQNVNKVNSKAVLRWNIVDSPSLNERDRARLLVQLQSKLTRFGEIVITSDRFRDQKKNRDCCIQKLNERVAAGLHVPKVRKKTKVSKGKKAQAKAHKKRHSEKKKLRSRSHNQD